VVLDVRELRVAYGDSEVIHGVSFNLKRGETLGILGESGSGKSSAVLSLIGLLPESAHASGEVTFDGRNILGASDRQLQPIRGRRIGVVYQDALRSLNPVMRIGDQIAEVFEAHGDRSGSSERAIELLDRVGIPHAPSRARMYPHEFSGGMRQRVMIAMALAYRPEILIADEPTTALDVTIQAQILGLIKDLAVDSETATILVTHDMGVIAQMCDNVIVMYAGRVVESGSADRVFADPKHPYTVSLLKSMPNLKASERSRFDYIPGQPPSASRDVVGCPFAPRCYAVEDRCLVETPVLGEVEPSHWSACLITLDAPDRQTPAAPSRIGPAFDLRPAVPSGSAERDPAHPLVELRSVSRHFRTKASLWSAPESVQAVDEVDMIIRRGESLGLVGESGSGKTTLGRVIAGLERPTAGTMMFDGDDVTGLRGSELRRFRKRAQMIYQDPRNSLNRRMTVRSILEEALRAAPTTNRRGPDTVRGLLDIVGLSPKYANRYPAEFSGGQAQRIAIARALAVEPTFVVADEAVSALDVSIQGQILNLLRDLQESLDLAFLFISHDLAVVQQACDRIAVMYFGKIVESGTSDSVFVRPTHPYSAALRSAHPLPDPQSERIRQRIVLTGDIPNPSNPPTGCRFHPRCPIGPTALPNRDICVTQAPELQQLSSGRFCACHFAGEIEEAGVG
jgi:oligopeptide/dipeptide ABC transporter ATP-binding protein